MKKEKRPPFEISNRYTTGENANSLLLPVIEQTIRRNLLLCKTV